MKRNITISTFLSSTEVYLIHIKFVMFISSLLCFRAIAEAVRPYKPRPLPEDQFANAMNLSGIDWWYYGIFDLSIRVYIIELDDNCCHARLVMLRFCCWIFRSWARKNYTWHFVCEHWWALQCCWIQEILQADQGGQIWGNNISLTVLWGIRNESRGEKHKNSLLFFEMSMKNF